MDAQRALLDELMGRNRDGDRPEEDVGDFRHARVCKRFLCGLCPHELFQNTKMDLGDCALLHTLALREAFERERLARPERDWGYEQELERELTRLVADVEKRIARAQRRLEEQEGAAAPSVGDVDGANSSEARALAAEIRSVLARAEESGSDGDVELSLALMDKVEELMQKMAMALANAMLTSFRAETSSVAGVRSARGTESPTADADEAAAGDGESRKPPPTDAFPANAPVNQKLRVCDVCGAFLSIFDSDRRLAEHFGGKLHLGYLQIRRKIKEIGEARRERRRVRNGVGGTEVDSPSKSGEKESKKPEAPAAEQRRDRRDRSKSRSRPRDDRSRQESDRRTRDRSRDRHDRDRHSGRRSRRRSRSRSSSRSRSRSPSRSRRRRRH